MARGYSNKNKILFIVFGAIYIALLVLIIYFSCESGDKSSEHSGVVVTITSNVLNFVGIKVNPESTEYKTLIRKLVGHFGLFFATSASGIFAIINTPRNKNKIYFTLGSLFIGIGVATLSEYIQGFAISRGPSIKDVGIDVLGYLIPILIYAVVYFLRYFKDKNKESLVEL